MSWTFWLEPVQNTTPDEVPSLHSTNVFILDAVLLLSVTSPL
jgi:hypothetical protein